MAWRRRAAAALLLLVLAAPGARPAAAQPPPADCQTCKEATACEARHRSCVATCRAQFFAVDPQRAACLDACTATAATCAQSTATACRSAGQCR